MLDIEKARERWQGVLAPIVTPFDANGRVDTDALQANLQWMLDRGARGGNTVFLTAGSGGDFTMMNLAERKQVITATAEVIGDRAPIIAGVQSLDVRDTIALCQLSEDLGLDAVQISGPFYYDGRPGDVIAWFEEVQRHTDIGFAVYNNWYTGYDMPLDLMDALCDLPNAIGAKWASPDLEIFKEGVTRLGKKVAVVNNTFETILGHQLGSRCFVSHWPNWYPEFCWRLWDLMEAAKYEEATEAFDRVNKPYQALVAEIARQTAGEGVFVRPFMRVVGLEGGFSRLPSRDAAVDSDLEIRIVDLLRSSDVLVRG